MREKVKVGDVEVVSSEDLIWVLVDNRTGETALSPGEAVALSRALVKAAAEALRVEV